MKFQLFVGVVVLDFFPTKSNCNIKIIPHTHRHTHIHTQRIKRPNTPIGDERKVLKTKRQCVAANFAVLLRRRRTLSWLSEREMSMAAANSPASISILYRKKSKEQRHIPRTAATETLSSYNVWCLCYLRVQNFPQNVIYHTRGTIHKHT